MRDIAEAIGAGLKAPIQVDHSGGGAGVPWLDSGPRYDRSCGVQRSYAPTTGLEPDRPRPADRPAQHGLRRHLVSAAIPVLRHNLASIAAE